jgi:type VI secretion system secreted protein Hcp
MRAKEPTAGLMTSMVLLLLLLVSPSFAAAERPQDAEEPPTIYLEIDPITHGMGQGTHANELPIDAMAHELTQPFDPGTGWATGVRLHSPLHVAKPVDPISPLLPLMVSTGQTLHRVTLRFYLADATGSEIHYYTILLEQARAVNYGFEGVGAKKNASEAVSFVYEIITWTDELSGVSRTDHWRSPGGMP